MGQGSSFGDSSSSSKEEKAQQQRKNREVHASMDLWIGNFACWAAIRAESSQEPLKEVQEQALRFRIRLKFWSFRLSELCVLGVCGLGFNGPCQAGELPGQI
eukprot:s3410_g3.t1